MRFRKKPIVVDAVQWFKRGDHPEVHSYAVVRPIISDEPFVLGEPTEWAHSIMTREGEMRVSRGDWIVRGVMGEFYPVKPDIFTATYEAVE